MNEVWRHNFYPMLIVLTNTHIALLAAYINLLAVIVILDGSCWRVKRLSICLFS